MVRDGTSVPYFPLKVEQQEGKWKVYNPVERGSYWLNDYAHYLLRLCDAYNTFDEIVQQISDQYGISSGSSRERTESILNPMTDAGMIWWRRERMRWLSTPPPQSVFWELTWECNQRCLHCVVSGGEKSPQELTNQECKQLADELAAFGVKSVAFSGGEPLLREDFFDIAEYVLRKGITLRVSTNGTLVDQRTAWQLKQMGFSVQVTLNGSTPEIHDRFCSMQNAYEKALRGVNFLISAGVPTTIATVATRANVRNIPEVFDVAARLGADAFRLIPFIPSGRGKHNHELELDPDEMREVTKNLRAKRGSGKIQVVPMEFEHTFDEPPGSTVDPSIRIGCDGAITYCTIGATGEVLPCSYFSGVETENVKEKPFSWIWANSKLLNYFRDLKVADIEGACRKCEWLSVCRTGCKAANISNGDLFGSNRHCWIACEMSRN